MNNTWSKWTSKYKQFTFTYDLVNLVKLYTSFLVYLFDNEMMQTNDIFINDLRNIIRIVVLYIVQIMS